MAGTGKRQTGTTWLRLALTILVAIAVAAVPSGATARREGQGRVAEAQALVDLQVDQSRGGGIQRTVAAPFLLLEPLSVHSGGSVKVSGYGFPADATLDVLVAPETGTPQPAGTVKTDDQGRFFGFPITLPRSMVAGSFDVQARSPGGVAEAAVRGYVSTSRAGVNLDNGVGNAGDQLTVAGWEFTPGETVAVYLNTIAGEPFARIPADEKGGFAEQRITMPYGPTGENTLIFVGERTQSPVLATYLMIGFFPTVELSTYAPRGDEVVSLRGEGFGPREKVRIYLNSLSSSPVAIVETDEGGTFDLHEGFAVPFGWYGRQTFLFVGELSATLVAADFEVMRYSPYAEPSTWSARAGTTVTFYGASFARSELVRVYRAATETEPAQVVSCFVTDDRGAVSGQGTYTIQADDAVGKLQLQLVGEKSEITVDVTVDVLKTSSKAPPAQIAANPGCFQDGGN